MKADQEIDRDELGSAALETGFQERREELEPGV